MCMTTEENQIHVLFDIAAGDVGPVKLWSDEHLKKYPNHRHFRMSGIAADHLALLNGESWLL